MKQQIKLVVAVAAGFAAGAIAIEGLHAQAKTAQIYVVAEIDVRNLDAYQKEYAPKAQALIKSSGGKLLAAGQNVHGVEGRPPAKRVAIQVWDEADYKKYRASKEFKEVRKIGDKYAKFRSFTVEALPQQ